MNDGFVYATRPNEDESGIYLVRAPLDPFDDLETVAELPSYDEAVANEDALYFVRSDQTAQLVIDRYSFDEGNTAQFHVVEPSFDSEMLSLLTATSDHVYYQRCETAWEFCTLFRVPVEGGSAVAYEHLRQGDLISALAAYDGVVHLGLHEKLLRVDTPQDAPVEFWTSQNEGASIGHILLIDSNHLAWTQRDQLWTLALD